MTTCKQCPFSKNNERPLEKQLGNGGNPFQFIGQSMGPFILPCHMDSNYDDKDTDPTKTIQCRGAAMFRKNIGISEKLPDTLLKAEEVNNDIFKSREEFLSHHLRIPIEYIELKEFVYIEMVKAELSRSQNRYYINKKIKQ